MCAGLMGICWSGVGVGVGSIRFAIESSRRELLGRPVARYSGVFVIQYGPAQYPHANKVSEARHEVVERLEYVMGTVCMGSDRG